MHCDFSKLKRIKDLLDSHVDAPKTHLFEYFVCKFVIGTVRLTVLFG